MRLRILHIILRAGATNGQYNEHCLPLRHERDISICTYFETPEAPPPEIRLYDGRGSLRGFFRALRAALAADDYDVIHAHAPQSGVLLIAGALLFGRLLRVRRRAVYTMQNSYQNYRLRNRLLMHAAFPFYRRIVLCSQATLDSLPPLLRRLGGDRLRVVQNAVDVARVDRALERVAPRPRADAFRVASVGRLIPIKNPFTLLESFARLSGEDARLVFVGDGELREPLGGSARERGCSDRVLFTGLVPRDEVFAQVAGADVFVSASRGEGLPVAVIEAMACGVPAILSDIPPHREIAEGVDFVPIVDADDVSGFCREIERVRQLSPEARKELGRCCRRLVIERFGLPRMHERLGRVYEEFVGHGA